MKGSRTKFNANAMLLKLHAANIIFSCIWMTTLQTLTFCKDSFGPKNVPAC